LTMADGTALSPDDYSSGTFQYSTDGGATWTAYTGAITGLTQGDHTLLISTTTVNDSFDEVDETFGLSATLSSNGTNYSDAATATIVDNDVPTIQFVSDAETGDITVPEGNDAVFTLHITGAAAGSSLVLTMADGTALSPADYSSGTFQYSTDGGATWTAYTGAITGLTQGDHTLLISTTTVNDSFDEADETFGLSATLSSNGTNYSDAATATIVDNDVPTIQFVSDAETGDITVPEGNDAVFTLHITGAADGSSLVLTMADGTALSPDDYSSGTFQYSTDGGATWTAYTGAITGLTQGDHTLLISTTTVNDSFDEADETFGLSATLSSNGTNYSDAATATIVDNDVPTIQFVSDAETGDISVPEGNDAVFTLHITGAADGSSLVLTMADGSAASPADYSRLNFQYSTDGGATWTPYTGTITGLTQGDHTLLISTTTVNDSFDEADETFGLSATLSSNGTNYSDAATATIVDNDVPTIQFVSDAETGDISVPEGNDAVFTLHITGAADGSSLVLTMADGSAASPADYSRLNFQYSTDGGATWTPYTGTITGLTQGDHTLLISTTTVNDSFDEADETFGLSATLSSNGSDYSDAATATIVDNDSPSIQVNDVTVAEGSDAVFSVDISGAAA
ncbi:beta strand repeat-containing protein, partial [Vogesella facilis]